MSEEILVKISKIENCKALKASADITLQTPHGELTIFKLKVIHDEGKAPWVTYPDIQYTHKESGDTRYLPIVDPGRPLRKAISTAVLNKYQEVCEDGTSF